MAKMPGAFDDEDQLMGPEADAILPEPGLTDPNAAVPDDLGLMDQLGLQPQMPVNQTVPMAPGQMLPPQQEMVPPVQMAVPAPSPMAPQMPVGGPSIGALNESQSSSKTQSVQLDPAALRSYEQKRTEQMAAEQEVLRLQAEAAEEQRKIAIQAVAKEEEQRKVFQEAENLRQTKIAEAENASNTAIDEVMKSKVNPNEYFDQMGIGGKIGAIISVGLGAMGAGSGGENKAMEIFNKAIAQNIDAQKANIGTKKDLANMKASVYARVLDSTGNERQAQLSQQLADLGMFKRKLEATVPRPERLSELAKANWQAMNAKIDSEFQLKKAELQKTVKENAFITSSKDQVIQGKDLPLITAEEGKTQRQMQANAVEFDKAADIVGQNKEKLGIVWGNFNKLLQRVGMDRKAFSDLDAKTQELTLKQAKAMLPGTLTDSDIKRIMNIVPGVTANPDFLERRLRELSNDNAKQSEGFKSAKSGIQRLENDLPEYSEWQKRRKQSEIGRKAGK